MPKIVSEDSRARSVSLSLTAAQIYILEKLAASDLRCGYTAVQAYREVIDRAGAEHHIYPYEYTSEGKVKTDDFNQWLDGKEWNGLYGSINPDNNLEGGGLIDNNSEPEYDGVDDGE